MFEWFASGSENTEMHVHASVAPRFTHLSVCLKQKNKVLYISTTLFHFAPMVFLVGPLYYVCKIHFHLCANWYFEKMS